jgi:hypothetical protein
MNPQAQSHKYDPRPCAHCGSVSVEWESPNSPWCSRRCVDAVDERLEPVYSALLEALPATEER